MITAVDTNVLLDVLLSGARFLSQSIQALEDATAAGSLVICDPVYADLCLHFDEQSTGTGGRYGGFRSSC